MSDFPEKGTTRVRVEVAEGSYVRRKAFSGEEFHMVLKQAEDFLCDWEKIRTRAGMLD